MLARGVARARRAPYNAPRESPAAFRPDTAATASLRRAGARRFTKF